MDRRRRVGQLRLLGAVVVVLTAVPLTARAFPPYRSTDAETADPWTLEARLGLIRVKHDAGVNEYSSPLLRVNFGLPYRIELVSELEYLPEEGRVGDAALGFKWIPLMDVASLGVEVLALLPVSEEGGAGVESSLLATYRIGDVFRTHVNVAGFYDARPSPAEWGWKAGAIGEFRLGRFRPGVEVFAKRVFGEPVQLLAGPGLIVKLGPVDVRCWLPRFFDRWFPRCFATSLGEFSGLGTPVRQPGKVDETGSGGGVTALACVYRAPRPRVRRSHCWNRRSMAGAHWRSARSGGSPGRQS